MGGCLRGCLVLVGVLILLPFLPVLLALYALYLVGRALLGLWSSDRPVRTKRLITGTVFFPAGVYFLSRYTRYSDRAKVGFLAAAGVSAVMLLASPAAGFSFVVVLGLVFAILFGHATSSEPVEPAQVEVRERPAKAAPADVPAPELRRLLEIEEARSTAERELLLAREFDRLASEVCGGIPLDRASWPSSDRLRVLTEEIDLLEASAKDPPVEAPVDPSPETYAGLAEAVTNLRSYADLLSALQAQISVPAERLRVLARERSRLQSFQDRLLEELGRPSAP